MIRKADLPEGAYTRDYLQQWKGSQLEAKMDGYRGVSCFRNFTFAQIKQKMKNCEKLEKVRKSAIKSRLFPK